MNSIPNEILFKTLIELKLCDLLNVRLVDQHLSLLLNDEYFWMLKLNHDFSKHKKSSTTSYQNYYKQLYKQTTKFFNKFTSFVPSIDILMLKYDRIRLYNTNIIPFDVTNYNTGENEIVPDVEIYNIRTLCLQLTEYTSQGDYLLIEHKRGTNYHSSIKEIIKNEDNNYHILRLHKGSINNILTYYLNNGYKIVDKLFKHTQYYDSVIHIYADESYVELGIIL